MFSKNRFFWIAALVGLLLDRITKQLIFYIFDPFLPPPGLTGRDLERFSQDLVAVIPDVFHLTFTLNNGAAWSSFPGGVIWLRWLSLAVSVGLLLYAWFGATLKRREQAAYGFILAGALGNGIDRFLWGYVVDFLNFRLIRFPVFNLADACINVGIVLLLIGVFQPSTHSGSDREPSRK